MKRIAVIGAGIAGMTAAYLLSRRHAVSLFEREPRLGGHTHTIRVPSADGEVALDTGFLVHNDHTYPNLVRLFAELKVATRPSDMSFSVTLSLDRSRVQQPRRGWIFRATAQCRPARSLPAAARHRAIQS